MEYKYKNPTDFGKDKIRLSLSQYSYYSGYKLDFRDYLFSRFDFYIDQNGLVSEKYANWFGTLIIVLVLPIAIITNGFNSVWNEFHRNCINPKSKGAFVRRKTFKNEKHVQKLIDLWKHDSVKVLVKGRNLYDV